MERALLSPGTGNAPPKKDIGGALSKAARRTAIARHSRAG